MTTEEPRLCDNSIYQPKATLTVADLDKGHIGRKVRVTGPGFIVEDTLARIDHRAEIHEWRDVFDALPTKEIGRVSTELDFLSTRGVWCAGNETVELL